MESIVKREFLAVSVRSGGHTKGNVLNVKMNQDLEILFVFVHQKKEGMMEKLEIGLTKEVKAFFEMLVKNRRFKTQEEALHWLLKGCFESNLRYDKRSKRGIQCVCGKCGEVVKFREYRQYIMDLVICETMDIPDSEDALDRYFGPKWYPECQYFDRYYRLIGCKHLAEFEPKDRVYSSLSNVHKRISELKLADHLIK